jgi:hypothetical protein
MRTKLIFLGFVISANELKMDPEKTKAIKNWPSRRACLKFEASMVWLDSTGNSSETSVELAHQ